MADGGAGLAIDLARPDERPVLEALFQLYAHDFSEFWADRAEGELGDDGRFAPYPPLDLYWRDPRRIPLLLRRGGRLAGFALINDHSHIGRPVDHAVAEFFVVRRHRRGGLGRAAAQAIFRRWPGSWEVAVARANRPALAFWRSAIAGRATSGSIEEIDTHTAEWKGPVFRFSVEPA